MQVTQREVEMPTVVRIGGAHISRNRRKQSSTDEKESAKAIRVAAYCRVSTEMESQTSSIETQVSVYTRRISQHKGWILSAIYSDDGATGTSVKKRKGFLRMVQDCEDGKIDCIITKSISRFARNTVECLTYVRRFKELGIRMIFEKENIDTAGPVSEMLLTVLAAFAQEESRSISENIKWAIRKRHETGESRWIPVYGYRKGENGTYIICEEEAAIIRTLFDLYEKGLSLPKTAKRLNELELPTPRGALWSVNTVAESLASEKYAGDLWLQKWYREDPLSPRAVRNDFTEIPSYYVRNHHTPIVSRKTFERVARIRQLRSNVNGAIPQYPYGDTPIHCPFCGERLVQRNMKCGKHKTALCCFGEDGCRKYAIKKVLLDQCMIKLYHEHYKGGAPSSSVEYYWLDELVKKVDVNATTIIVNWKSGNTSSTALEFGQFMKPELLAQSYRELIAKGDADSAKGVRKPVEQKRADGVDDKLTEEEDAT